MSFRRYPAYKDSGLDWIGKIPEGWQLKPLKYVVSCNDEALPDNTPEDFEIMYVEISDVDEVQGITNLTQMPFGQAPSRARRVARDGDVLVSTVRTYLRAIAPVEQAPCNLVASTGFAVVRPRSLHYRFAGYLLRAEWLISRIIARSVGVNYPAIRADEIIGLSVPVPSNTEQRKIAEFLDHETVKIDALIEEQQRLIELLEEKRQAVISHAVTKGLDPDAPMKDSGVEWLGEVPAHWEVCRITHHLSSIVDYRGKTPQKDATGVFLVTARNIRDGKIDYEASKEFITEAAYQQVVKRGLPEVGDVVFTTEAPLGEVANLDRDDVALAQRVIKFRGAPSIVDDYFLKYWIMGRFCQSQLESLATGSTALGIKGSKVNQLIFCLPPHGEQKEIVDDIDRLLHEIDHLADSGRRLMGLLQERRSALISAAVTGKIDVRNWQLRAESAEGLPMATEEPATYETSEP